MKTLIIIGVIMMVIILRFLFLKIFPQKYAPKNQEASKKYHQEYPDDEIAPKTPFDPSIEKRDTIGPFEEKNIQNQNPNPKEEEVVK